jgi:hypothetical protein
MDALKKLCESLCGGVWRRPVCRDEWIELMEEGAMEGGPMLTFQRIDLWNNLVDFDGAEKVALGNCGLLCPLTKIRGVTFFKEVIKFLFLFRG